MCKFNSKLFLFLVMFSAFASSIQCSPIETLLEEYLEAAAESQDDADYDLIYDERQKGTENYRLNIDGVMIGVPAASQNSIGSLGLLASNYLLDFAAATSHVDENDDDNDDDDDDGDDVGSISADDDNKPYLFELHDLPETQKKDEKPKNNKKNELKPENIFEFKNNEKVSNKKDLKVDLVASAESGSSDAVDATGSDAAVMITMEKPLQSVNGMAKAEQQQTRQKSGGAQKRRNKHKLRLGHIIEYLKRSQS